MRELLKQYLTEKKKCFFTKWLLTGGGRHERVDCTLIFPLFGFLKFFLLH